MPTNAITNRKVWIDISKGVGIILVVIGHVVSEKSIAHRYIYMFHMPLFFIISGYLFNETKVRTFSSLFIGKVKRLMVPFCFFLFVPALFYGLIKGAWRYFYEWPITEIVLADPPIWFLFVLFLVSILYFIKSCRNIIVLAFVSLLFLTMSRYFNVRFYIDTIAISLLFYAVGNKMRNLKVGSFFWGKSTSLMNILIVLLLIAIMMADVLYEPLPEINYRAFAFKDVGFVGLISYAMIGSLSVFALAMQIRENTYIGRLLSYCGRNSLIIMCAHWYIMRGCTSVCSNIYLAIVLTVVLSIALVPVFNNRFTKFIFELK